MLNVKLCSQTYLEPSRTSVEFFSLWLSHMVKTYLVPFRFHFLHNSPFREKTYDSENFGRKTLLLTMKHFFFEIRNYAMEWRHQ